MSPVSPVLQVDSLPTEPLEYSSILLAKQTLKASSESGREKIDKLQGKIC